MPGGLTPNVQAALAGIVVLLAASTLAVAGLVRCLPRTDFGELTARTRTWWVMVGILVLATALGRTVSLVFLAFVSFLALREYVSMVPTRRADRAVVLWAYAAIPLQFSWIAAGRIEVFVVFVPLYAMVVPSAIMVLIGATRGFLNAAGTLQLGLMATVFGLGHLAALAVLPDGPNPAGGGTGLLVYLVFLAQFNDVIQYVGGRLLGRRRVLPRVSPNKTWAGVICGLLVTVLLALVLAPWLTPLSHIEAAAAGVLIAASGFAGDVTISAVKRDLGLADTGRLLPGHGGVLDRVDSLIFAAPLFFHFVYQLHYAS